MNKFFLLLLLTLSSAFASDYPYYYEWCNNVDSRIRVAMQSAQRAQTFEEERSLLLNAVQASINEVPEKDNYYFLQTLIQITENINNYHSAQDQALYLRSYIRYALADLRYLDEVNYRYGCFFCKKDHSKYVAKIIQRGLTEGLASPSDVVEVSLLNQAATTAAYYLDNSSYRRSYACARKSIAFAMQSMDVRSKREHLRNAYQALTRHICF